MRQRSRASLNTGVRRSFPPQIAGVDTRSYRSYNNLVKITYDPDKRDKTFAERGLDFEDAAIVFAGTTLEIEDTRKDYGEVRMICYGYLQERLVVIGYAPRGEERHVFSMRKGNAREKKRIAPRLEI